MLYRFLLLIAFTAKGNNLGYYFLITSVVTLLTCAELIQNCFLVLKIGFCRKKPAIYCFFLARQRPFRLIISGQQKL
jgi:hypothetical protein